MPKTDALQVYVEAVSRIAGAGYATPELSYYPPLVSLLSALGAAQSPPLQATSVITVPGVRRFPDVGLIEAESRVLVIPVEAKPVSWTLASIAATAQAEEYARVFGAGSVILTNLWQFAFAHAEESGKLHILDTISLGSDAQAVFSRKRVDRTSLDRLATAMRAASQLRGVLKEPRDVASLLAYHAKSALRSAQSAGGLRKIVDDVAKDLHSALGSTFETNELFTSSMIQMISYGLFAGWLHAADPQHYQWQLADREIPSALTAALLRRLTAHHTLEPLGIEPHIAAIGRVLNWVDRAAFQKRFSAGKAVEYFYEPFLEHYDPDLRDALGVWYTPREIADYQVRRVHEELVESFGFAEGLRDSRVTVLDPASGTGTYLTATLAYIHALSCAAGHSPAEAASEVRRACGRIIGFEVLPAPFVISHISVAVALRSLGVSQADALLRIILTNSLHGWGSEHQEVSIPELRTEQETARRIKRTERVIVVIGNPPYQGYAGPGDSEERALIGDWVDSLHNEWGIRKSRLGNELYARFWRMAKKRIAEISSRGVVSFITNRKWLGGRSFPSMRESISRSFTKIIVDDLHGDVHDGSHPGDESVFTTEVAAGIQRGVAIVTAVRRAQADGVARVWRRDYRGTATQKRTALVENQLGVDGYVELPPLNRDGRFRFVEDSSGDFRLLSDYFGSPEYFSGVQPIRDESMTAQSGSRDKLEARLRRYFDRDVTVEQLAETHPEFFVKRARYDARRVRARLITEFDAHYEERRLVPYLYRPMDCRWLYWETRAKLLNEARADMFETWSHPSQISIVAAQTPRRLEAARPSVTTAVAGFASCDPDARVFLRWRRSFAKANDMFGGWNWSHTIREDWIERVRSVFSPVEVDRLRDQLESGEKATAQDVCGDVVFFALIAIMHSPAWVRQATGNDQDDFPGVPVPSDPERLRQCALVGREVARIVDPLVPVEGVSTGRISPELRRIGVPDEIRDPVDRMVTRDHWEAEGDGGILWWNEHSAWRGVPRTVMEYRVSGFSVLTKWLSYRKGTSLTDDDVQYVTQVMRRVAALHAKTGQLDQLFKMAEAQQLEPAP